MLSRGSSRGVILLRNILALSVSQLITWSSTALLVAFLPSRLGASAYGKLSVVYFIVSFLCLFIDMGSTSYLTKEVARRESNTSAATYMLNALLLRLPITATAILMGALFVNVFGYDAVTRNVFYVLVPTLVAQAMSQVFGAGLIAIQKMGPLAVAGTATKVIYAVGAVVLLLTGHSILAVAAFFSFTQILYLVMVGFFALRNLSFHSHPNVIVAKAVFFGSLPFFTWQAALLIYGQIDMLQLSIMANAAAVGWYAAAYQIILIPAFIPTILVTALFPLLATIAHTERQEFIRLSRQSIRIVVLTIMPLSLGTAVLASQIIGLFGYPPEFHKSIPLIAILALHMPSAAAATVIGTCLNSLDRQRPWAIIGIGAAILNPLMNLAAIPITSHLFQNPAIGPAVITDVTEYMMLSASLVLLPRDILSRAEAEYVARCVLAGAVMAAIVWLVRDAGIFIAVPIGAAAYLGASLLFKTTNLNDIRTAIARVLVRGRNGGEVGQLGAETG